MSHAVSHAVRRLSLAAALVVAAACASARANGGSMADVFVYFANNSIHQANVYAVSSGGTSTRVGTLFPGRRERLRLPATVLGGTRTIELTAQLLTSPNRPRSGPITLFPGDSLEIQLSTDGSVLSVLPLRGSTRSP